MPSERQFESLRPVRQCMNMLTDGEEAVETGRSADSTIYIMLDWIDVSFNHYTQIRFILCSMGLYWFGPCC